MSNVVYVPADEINRKRFKDARLVKGIVIKDYGQFVLVEVDGKYKECFYKEQIVWED